MKFIYEEKLQAQMNTCGTSQIVLLTFGTILWANKGSIVKKE
jgi:hypothetical protein